MATLWSQASAYLGRTNITANYEVDDSRPPVQVGLWKIHAASRRAGAGSATGAAAVTVNRGTVSLWVHEFAARGARRARIVEHLKRGVSALSRLRHPCILEVVEPLEESRTEVMFVTEHVSTTLAAAISPHARPEIQLDEVEIQKGLLQTARALEFLHDAKLIHTNITPGTVLVNAKGDWKLGGFAYLTSLGDDRGASLRWAYDDDGDGSVPAVLARNMDYEDPAYLLDGQVGAPNDMFSLGAVIFAIFHDGRPPVRNHGSLHTLRGNAENLPGVIRSEKWDSLGTDLQDILSHLVSRMPAMRYDAKTFQNLPYFKNLLVSVLKFMERDSFAARTKEEKCQFLRGLLKVLPQFSTQLQRRKVLPSVLELMTDRSLLPYILPVVFAISKNASSIEFTKSVLPRIKPLFNISDPPQTQMLLLNNLEVFVSKTSPSLFRSEVTPLLYSALDSQHIAVQENALRRVPRICELLEYSHVKDTLFPALSTLFGKTKTLSVKVGALICFHAMVPVLDKNTLTDELVPTLARIKTREPSVMVATLAVHEALSKKVSRETLGTAVLPQLWTMSMCPALNDVQFGRFMHAIREIGTRVEQEHMAYLREQKSLRSQADEMTGNQGNTAPRGSNAGVGASGEIDFASLVGHAKKEDAAHGLDSLLSSGPSTPAPSTEAFDSLLSAPVKRPVQSTPVHQPAALSPANTGASAASSLEVGSSVGTLASSFPAPSPKPAQRTLRIASPPRRTPNGLAPPPVPAGRPAASGAGGTGLFDTLLAGDNRNRTAPQPAPAAPPTLSMPPAPTPSAAPPPGWTGGMLQPASTTSRYAPKPSTQAQDAWADFDPLK